MAAAQAARNHRQHMSQLAREQREQRAAVRAAEKRRKELERNVKIRDKEKKKQYLEARQKEAEERNREVQLIVRDLRNTLSNTFDFNDSISFESLKHCVALPVFTPASELLSPSLPPSREAYLSQVKAPTGVGSLFPGAKRKHEEDLQRANIAYSMAAADWKKAENDRLRKLEALKQDFEISLAAFYREKAEQDAKVHEFEIAYRSGDIEAVGDYCRLVLDRSDYPESFARSFELAYEAASRQIVIDMMLPGVDIIPTVVEFSYSPRTDEIREKLRKPSEIKALYQDLIASIALRTLHEIFEADQGDHIEVVSFNGNVIARNRSTGRNEEKCLISVRATKSEFLAIDLRHIDRNMCLRNLGANVSRDPDEAVAVKPIVSYDMVDRRFVDQSDILSDLDASINLMDLDPFQFEHLVANLFGKLGLETKLTQSSRDGGVDCIAFDTRPIVGGKIVIQAKRYKNTVGVGAVRDLYGTMLNEGASKGLLVCTSGYGPDAFEFAKDKPIELIDGGGLLYLLKDAGIAARIVFPNE